MFSFQTIKSILSKLLKASSVKPINTVHPGVLIDLPTNFLIPSQNGYIPFYEASLKDMPAFSTRRAFDKQKPEVLCKECLKEDQRGILDVGSTYLIVGESEEFFDMREDYHIHDESVLMQYFLCDKGHKYAEFFWQNVCFCGFNKDIEPVYL